MPHILLLGGHGKVSLLMTPKLLSRAWNITSVTRSSSQIPTILSAANSQPGNLTVLVYSLEDIKSTADATALIQKASLGPNGPVDWIIWSAGAGGKGGYERTYAIDRDACVFFIEAGVKNEGISKFLLISALSNRRVKAGWWSEGDWEAVKESNEGRLKHYYQAKMRADEVFSIRGAEREGWGWICLRPGALGEGEAGRVSMGKTGVKGVIGRGDVAEVGVRLLEKDGVRGWFDLLDGDKEVGEEVERMLREGVDSMEGESLEVMKENIRED